MDPGQHRDGRAKGEVSRMQRYLCSLRPKVQNGYVLKRSTRAAAREQSHVQLLKEKEKETKDLIEKLHDEKKKRVNLEKRERYCKIE